MAIINTQIEEELTNNLNMLAKLFAKGIAKKESTTKEVSKLKSLFDVDEYMPQKFNSDWFEITSTPLQITPSGKLVKVTPSEKPLEVTPTEKEVTTKEVSKLEDQFDVDKYMPQKVNSDWFEITSKPLQITPSEKSLEVTPTEKPLEVTPSEKPLEVTPVEKPLEVAPVVDKYSLPKDLSGQYTHIYSEHQTTYKYVGEFDKGKFHGQGYLKQTCEYCYPHDDYYCRRCKGTGWMDSLKGTFANGEFVIEPKKYLYINVIKEDELDETINGIYNYYYIDGEYSYWYTGNIKNGKFHDSSGQIYKWIPSQSSYHLVKVGKFINSEFINGDQFTYKLSDNGQWYMSTQSINGGKVIKDYGFEEHSENTSKQVIIKEEPRQTKYTKEYIDSLTVQAMKEVHSCNSCTPIKRYDDAGPIDKLTGWYDITFTNDSGYSSYKGEMLNGYFDGIGCMYYKNSDNNSYQFGVFGKDHDGTKGQFIKGELKKDNITYTGNFHCELLSDDNGKIENHNHGISYRGKITNGLVVNLNSTHMEEQDVKIENCSGRISKRYEDKYAIIELPTAKIYCELIVMPDLSPRISYIPLITFNNGCVVTTNRNFDRPVSISGNIKFNRFEGEFKFPDNFKRSDMLKLDRMTFKFFLMATFPQLSETFFDNYTGHELTHKVSHTIMEKQDWKDLGMTFLQFDQFECKMKNMFKILK
jgi:hypothetical protein